MHYLAAPSKRFRFSRLQTPKTPIFKVWCKWMHSIRFDPLHTSILLIHSKKNISSMNKQNIKHISMAIIERAKEMIRFEDPNFNIALFKVIDNCSLGRKIDAERYLCDKVEFSKKTDRRYINRIDKVTSDLGFPLLAKEIIKINNFSENALIKEMMMDFFGSNDLFLLVTKIEEVEN